jgi:hypothetical protein
MNDKENDSVILFQQFIGLDKDVMTYLHNTPDHETERKILKDGFNFEEDLDHTSDRLSGVDIVELEYFKYVRQSYGYITIVIQIGKDIINKYSTALNSGKYHFSEVLANEGSQLSNNDRPVHVLPVQFIKGSFDQKENIITNNPLFNPHFYDPQFEINLEKLLKS